MTRHPLLDKRGRAPVWPNGTMAQCKISVTQGVAKAWQFLVIHEGHESQLCRGTSRGVFGDTLFQSSRRQ